MITHMCGKCGCTGNILMENVTDTTDGTLKKFTCGTCGYTRIGRWEYVTDVWDLS